MKKLTLLLIVLFSSFCASCEQNKNTVIQTDYDTEASVDEVEICPDCDGSGFCDVMEDDPFCHGSGDCPACDGEGRQDTGYGLSVCPICQGHGKCTNCGGSGQSRNVRTCSTCGGTGNI